MSPGSAVHPESATPGWTDRLPTGDSCIPTRQRFCSVHMTEPDLAVCCHFAVYMALVMGKANFRMRATSGRGSMDKTALEGTLTRPVVTAALAPANVLRRHALFIRGEHSPTCWGCIRCACLPHRATITPPESVRIQEAVSNPDIPADYEGETSVVIRFATSTGVG